MVATTHIIQVSYKHATLTLGMVLEPVSVVRGPQYYVKVAVNQARMNCYIFGSAFKQKHLFMCSSKIGQGRGELVAPTL